MNKSEKFKSSVTFRHVVKQFSTLEEASFSDTYYARGLPWQIKVSPYYDRDEQRKKFLWLWLYCGDAEEYEMHTLSCDVHAVLRIVSQKQGVPDIVQDINGRFNIYNDSHKTYPNKLWQDICDADKGYIKDDVVIFEAEVISIVPDLNEAKQGVFQKMMQEFMRKFDRFGHSFSDCFPLVIDPSGRKTSSDVTLVCQDKKFYCHWIILSERSTTFRSQFEFSKETDLKQIDLDDENISGNTMLEILRLFYCRCIATDLTQAPPEVQHEFLYAAGKYNLQHLFDLLSFALEESLEPSNACRYLLNADSYGLLSLKILCFAMMENPDNESAIRTSPEYKEVLRRQELVNEFNKFKLSTNQD